MEPMEPDDIARLEKIPKEKLKMMIVRLILKKKNLTSKDVSIIENLTAKEA